MISVVVPVYNVEKYLQKCVESILRQTYRDLEIILVDDGSTDSCPALCDAFARSDERVRVIHRENGGLSAARNTGMETAAGEYIAFVDSDDHLLPQMYETMLGKMETSGAEIVMCGFSVINTEGSVALNGQAHDTWSGSGAEYLKKTGLTCNYAWNKLFLRELFSGIRFPEGKTYEDIFIMHDVFWRAKKISVIPDPLYVYLRRPGSLSGSLISPHRLDLAESLVARLGFLLNAGIPEGVALYYVKEIFGVWDCFHRARKFSDPVISGGWKASYKKFRSVTKGISRDWTLSNRVKLALMRIHPVLYRFCPEASPKAKTLPERILHAANAGKPF